MTAAASPSSLREADTELIATAPFGQERLRDAFGLIIGNLEDEIAALRTKSTSLVRNIVDDATAPAQRAQASVPDGADPSVHAQAVDLRLNKVAHERSK